ncbi:MAG: sigma-70 family RNA polymerase sigma factor [Isosphaeraceae bacterium]
MRTIRQGNDADGFASLDSEQTRVLSTDEERELLQSLAECKRKLADALGKIPGADVPEGADDPQALAQYIASFYAGNAPYEARLGAVFRRYSELRGKLALANMRLVAHVAKRFRDRGIAYSDLLQEGFCGLLEAIDRFDLGHETKLATYATWWIRQAMQRAVASGAYPVRLSPRHLRQLAQNQSEIDRVDGGASEGESLAGATEMIQRIHAATRPTVSLDAGLDGDSHYSLLHSMSDPEGDHTGDVETDETVTKLLEVLRPREQEVLALRFGLGGKPRLSLSQVGQVLEVSKERVRQIQDRALEKLRAAVDVDQFGELVLVGS